MRLRVKRGTTAVIASDKRGSASFELRLSLAMNAVGLNRGRTSCGPRLHFFLTAVGPGFDRVCFLYTRLRLVPPRSTERVIFRVKGQNCAYYNLYLGLGVVYRLFAAR